jgi:hypothetical protein
MTAKQRKRIRVEQLRKISINEIIYSDSWIRQFGDTTVELIHHHDGIRLLVNGCLQPVCWRIYERHIRGKLANGGYIPLDKCWDYYIFGYKDGKRYKYLLSAFYTSQWIQDRDQRRLSRDVYDIMPFPLSTQAISALSAG